jgi:chromosome segregation ATPase
LGFVMDDIGSDARWMTYAELGLARGITTASATRLVFRRKWHRRTREDGIALIAVPADALHPRGNNASKSQRRIMADDRDDGTLVIVNALQAAVAVLKERTEAAERRAEKAELRAEQAEMRAASAEQGREGAENRAARTEQSLDGERARADALRNELEAALAQLTVTRAEVHVVTNRERSAGAAHARLCERLAAAEGQIASEQARAVRVEREREELREAHDRFCREMEGVRRRVDQAEKGRDGERARADALRDRLGEMQAQLAAAEQIAARATWQVVEAGAGAGVPGPADDVAAVSRGLVARLRTVLRGSSSQPD